MRDPHAPLFSNKFLTHATILMVFLSLGVKPIQRGRGWTPNQIELRYGNPCGASQTNYDSAHWNFDGDADGDMGVPTHRSSYANRLKNSYAYRLAITSVVDAGFPRTPRGDSQGTLHGDSHWIFMRKNIISIQDVTIGPPQ